ncbi:MAG: transcriptional regulator [Mesorhizobium sp.]|nr:transcriptional regulator [Mesorhizobium sp. M4B.F.Ca.ET.058.02.1.1]RUW20728.1 transcriptional regulator [Mesorhizobium sp. M4B.F.Ca.ET.013.02.1.1]RUW75142.1 transcriptional regulator [Mesorhizobium sp. M4B.F.Ca.ET.049.02.1.2]RUX43631.1 transcriptional regulator [Mesorhizobium sp. M4A.F.Ca.ET.050.02.1.1]RVC43708.1 transcriptional regulator [Mesorhizobium sp. M4A.F.Ca.ET.090.04.2.1]RVC54387.1 transcriptional regulator [Mesorhizobium sp. M4B.F.Ca.ET.088.02.2.1]RVC73394.1 transcriptional regu
MRYRKSEVQGGTFLLLRHPHITEDCRAVSEILQRVGDKWTVLVVGKLGDGPLRFNELRAAVGGISQKMLTTTLRGLERDGFVIRTVFPTIPPRVDYELTELGHELLVPVSALGAWARRNTARVRAAREKFDGLHG